MPRAEASTAGYPHAGRRPRADLRGMFAFSVAIAAALVIGGLSSAKPHIAVGLVVAAAAAVLVAMNMRMLPPILVVTVFAEGVSVGGFHVGRVVGLLALAAVAYFLLAGGRADLRANLLMLCASALGFLILLSFYWAPSLQFAVKWFFQWALSLAFAVAFAVLVRTERHLRAVLIAFVCAAAAFGVVGLLTFVASGGASRGTGLTGDPNQFATYEALALPIALALAARERIPHRRLPFYGVIVVVILAIVASYSRGGVVTLGVLIVGTLLAPRYVFFRNRAQKGTYLLILLASAWVVALVGSTAYIHRLGTLLTGSDRGSGRTDLWAAAWNGYSHHQYAGLGAGGFEARSLDLLHATPGVDIAASYVQAGRPVHNAYLEMLVDLGPAGLVLFLALVGLTLFYLLRSAQRFRGRGDVERARIAITLGVALLGLSASMVFLSIELGHMLWAFTGLALALERASAPAGREASASVRRRRRRLRAPRPAHPPLRA